MKKSRHLVTAALRRTNSASGRASTTVPAGIETEPNELDLAIQMQQAHQLTYMRTLKHFERYNHASGVWAVLTAHTQTP